MNTRNSDLTKIVLGIVLVVGGIALLRACPDRQGAIEVLPFLLLGVGCGLFGHGMGSQLQQKALKDHPELQKEIAIEQNSHQAKAKGYNAAVSLFGGLSLVYVFMGVGLVPILLLLACYLAVSAVAVYHMVKLQKTL